MKKNYFANFLFFICLLLFPAYFTLASSPAIIPLPVKITTKSGHFHLRSSTVIQTDLHNPELLRLAGFFADKVHFGGGPAFSVKAADQRGKNVIILRLGKDIPEIGSEGYHLSINRKRVLLEANTTRGIFYGLQSLFQLLPPDVETSREISSKGHWKTACLEIIDYPRFSYRGLHLDVCRHFFPIAFIKEYIELLSIYKMNTFHWHLTDDQGWRIEIKKYPLLTQVGSIRKGTQVAKSDAIDDKPYGGFYTQDEIRDVIKYATEHYINIIPEIEMPGHAVAALTAYPRFSCTGGPFEVRTMWGVSDDVFCPGKDSTFLFIQDILSEVMQIFPYQYIHIGGDEVPKSRWTKCPLCQQRIKEQGLNDENELQSYFVQRIEKFLKANGRKLIGWDEILEGGLAPEATVMSWRGLEGGITAAKQGHDVIMTPGEYCYFDHLQADPSYEPLAIGGYTNLKKVYSLEPAPAELTATEARHILGAQGNLWTEYIEKGDHAIYMAYPRAMALAEVDWSPKETRDWPGFINRLEQHFIRLDHKGVNYCKSLFDVSINTVPLTGSPGMNVALSTDWQGVDIRYSLDGSDPGLNSPQYKKPFPITHTSLVRATVYKDKVQKGRINEKQVLVHKAFGKKVELLTTYSDKYPGQGVQTITDGLRGSVSFRAGEWQGYNGNDFEGIIDLGEITAVNSITANFMKNIYSWIHFPNKIEYSVSDDGKNFSLVGTLECPPVKSPGIEIRPFTVKTDNLKTRYIKVKAYNIKVNPPWHESAGLPCWIFIDEVVVD